MALTHLIQLPTTDNTILADQIVTLISFICLAIILMWTLVQFRRDHTMSLRQPMSIACILSISCFTMFAFVGSIGWTNVIFPISTISCKLIYPFALINYNIAKIAMYWLFTLRIQVIFQHSALEFNRHFLWIYRLCAALIPSILWSIWIYLSFVDLEPHRLQTYSHCFPLTFRDPVFASHIAAALAWTDLIFSGIALCIFIHRLYRLTQITNHNLMDTPPAVSRSPTMSSYGKLRQSLLSPSKISQKWMNTIRKSTLLCIIAIVSTWSYVLGTAYILRQCGFFIAFDGVINSLCIAYLFKFADKYYNRCCHPVEKCCIDIICCCQCCKSKQTALDLKDDSNKSSMGGAIRLYSNEHEVVLKYHDHSNDFSMSAAFKPVTPLQQAQAVAKEEEQSAVFLLSSVSDSKEDEEADDDDQVMPLRTATQRHTTPEVHANVSQHGVSVDDVSHEHQAAAETGASEMEENEQMKEWMPHKLHHRRSPSPKMIGRASPSPLRGSTKHRAKSVSAGLESVDNESEKSATFMLLEMTDDEHDEDGDDVYHHEERLFVHDADALLEGDEDDEQESRQSETNITDTDEDDDEHH